MSDDDLEVPGFLKRSWPGNETPAATVQPVAESTVATPTEQPVARPLKVLIPLILADMKEGDDAAEKASMPYYRAAGEKMLEAKAQLKHGEFMPWLKRNLDISQTTANLYMRLAREQINGAPLFSSLREFEDRPRPKPKPRPESAQAAFNQAFDEVFAKNRRQDLLNQGEERKAESDLGRQIVARGYKSLAKELHPDKIGGDRTAMVRLNRARDRLKANV
jgi:hypothetical protein